MPEIKYTVPSLSELASDLPENCVPTEQMVARLHHEERRLAERKSEYLEALTMSAPPEWQNVLSTLVILEEDHRRTYAYLIEHHSHWMVMQAEAGMIGDS